MTKCKSWKMAYEASKNGNCVTICDNFQYLDNDEIEKIVTCCDSKYSVCIGSLACTECPCFISDNVEKQYVECAYNLKEGE